MYVDHKTSEVRYQLEDFAAPIVAVLLALPFIYAALTGAA